MNYKQSLALLNSLDNFEKTNKPSANRFLNLDRVRCVLELLGNPEKKFPAILVGGTNGKGSTAFFLAESLRAAGYKTGLYTSPHLEDMRERIQVNSCWISEKEFASQSEKLKNALSRYRSDLGRVTYFEWLTLLAFQYFKSKKIDIAVLEVGMGGRLDATNSVTPLLTVITPIGLDHTNELGKKLSKVAAEKSFLIHSKRPVVSAKQKAAAGKVLRDRARKMKSPLFEEGADFKWEYEENVEDGEIHSDWTWRTRSFVVGGRVQEKPAYLIQNMSLVVMALKLLKEKYGFKKISFQKASKIFEGEIWPGRFEFIQKNPAILLDGVHNPDGAEKFSESLNRAYSAKGKVLIFAVSSDKDVSGILKKLRKIKPQLFIATCFKNPRCLSVRKVYQHAKKFFPSIRQTSSLPEALRLAKRSVSRDDLIVVAGSLYLVGEARQLLKRKSERRATSV